MANGSELEPEHFNSQVTFSSRGLMLNLFSFCSGSRRERGISVVSYRARPPALHSESTTHRLLVVCSSISGKPAVSMQI